MKHPAGTRHLTARRAALAALILTIAAAAAAAFCSSLSLAETSRRFSSS